MPDPSEIYLYMTLVSGSQLALGLLLSARQVGDIDRILHVWCCSSTAYRRFWYLHLLLFTSLLVLLV